MNPKINWQALTNTLKSEVQRVTAEIKNFDYQAVLTPAAQQKVKEFEKSYAQVMKRLQKVQRQADREFNRVLRQVKTQQATMMDVVGEQKSRLEKMSVDLKKRFYAPVKTKAKKKTPKKRVRKTSAKKD